jgi:hypothetical protein
MNRFSTLALLSLLASTNAFTMAPTSVRTVCVFSYNSSQQDSLVNTVSHCLVISFLSILSFQTARTTQLNIMTPEETETILKKADSCAEGECSIDDVTELISILKEQQKEIYDRLIDIKASIKSLESVNESDERKVDEVRETVRSLFRIFQLGAKASGNDYPALMKPSGWSGEVGDGPKTACKFYA